MGHCETIVTGVHYRLIVQGDVTEKYNKKLFTVRVQTGTTTTLSLYSFPFSPNPLNETV